MARAGGDREARGRRVVAFDLAVFLVLLALFVANLCLGSVETTPVEVIGTLAAGPGDASAAAQVIWQIRLPRAVEAVLLGGALSLSGFLLQTFFANPIADPFVLGVSSGAKLVVALVMIVALGAGQVMNPTMSVGAAAVGSLVTMGFVLLISRRVRSQSMLIVAGVMVGYICSAATNFLVAFADDQSIVNLDNWSRGSFSGATWSDVGVIAVVCIAMLLGRPAPAFLDWIILLTFCGYIGLDWGRADRVPRTTHNAISVAASIYIDVINLFLTILRILSNRRD